MKGEFTPGPWEVSTGMVQTVSIHKGCKLAPGLCDVHTPIAWMDRKPGNETMPVERDANAKLIAAAPELLEGCQHALLMLAGLSTDGEITMTGEGKDRITAQLRDAIQKATGGL